ncbi:DTD1 isoform 2, partial [Pan troglodytes]
REGSSHASWARAKGPPTFSDHWNQRNSCAWPLGIEDISPNLSPDDKSFSRVVPRVPDSTRRTDVGAGALRRSDSPEIPFQAAAGPSDGLDASSPGNSLVGLRVVAKWSSNGYFYSGKITRDVGGKYKLLFDDGYECDVLGKDILLCDPIPLDTEVTALSEDEYFSAALTALFPLRVRKILNLRVFEDESGKHWSKSVMDKQYEISVCQPSLPSRLLQTASWSSCVNIQSGAYQNGKFGAYMQVHIQNDGPVTIELESPAPGTATSDPKQLSKLEKQQQRKEKTRAKGPSESSKERNTPRKEDRSASSGAEGDVSSEREP